MPKLSFYTTCKNRTFHLKETYIHNIEYFCERMGEGEVEFILLDYSSEDDLHEWLRTDYKARLFLSKQILKVYRIENQHFFKMSHAKNVAAKLCTGTFIGSLDADVKFKDDVFSQIIENMENKIIINTAHIHGFIICRKEHFMHLKGYDEGMEGWGAEDKDMVNRLLTLTKSVIFSISDDLLERIEHGHVIRLKDTDKKNMNPEEFIETMGEKTMKRMLKHHKEGKIIINETFGEGEVMHLHAKIEVPSKQKEDIYSIFLDDELSDVEKLCIKSFLYHGHKFKLYTYGDVNGVPEGVEILDANKIIIKNELFRSNYTLTDTGIQNVFKFAHLYMHGGVWVDMDVVCIKEINFSNPYLFTVNKSYDQKLASPVFKFYDNKTNTTIIKAPPKSDIMKIALSIAHNTSKQIKTWGNTEVILDCLVREMGLNEYFSPLQKHGFFNWYEFDKLFTEIDLPNNCETIKIHADMFTKRKLNKDGIYNKKSLLEKLKQKYF